MRDLLDAQMQTADGVRIGRIAPGASRSLHLARPLRAAHPYERMSEVVETGLTVRLRGNASDYPIGQSGRWLANHIVPFIPGSGA